MLSNVSHGQFPFATEQLIRKYSKERRPAGERANNSYIVQVTHYLYEERWNIGLPQRMTQFHRHSSIRPQGK